MAAVSAPAYRWAIEVLREDGTPVATRPVTPDFGPGREWTRWQAIRRGRSTEAAFTDPVVAEPTRDGTGAPGITGVRLRSVALACDVGLTPFQDPARATIAALVREGVLFEGDRVCWRALAEAGDADPAHRLGRELPPPITLRQRARCTTVPPEADDDPVLLPDSVLDEVAAITHEHRGQETGGILVGHLCRDAGQRLFVDITAQVPARYTTSAPTRLTFTPDSWADVRAAVALRGREEIMLGWWHSHPVRAWCASCPPECRSTCSLAAGFLSPEDRRLHRVVFPRAYSVALVASDAGETAPAFALFGWRRGELVPRPFTRTEAREP
jgi:hypothetical protein